MFYRLRKSLSYSYFQYRTRDILKSAPIACNPDGSCEVHTMLSAADMPLYLVAIKSLLRFHNGMAVVVHSDGTLRDDQIELLKQQIPQCRVVTAPEADALAARTLAGNEFLQQWRNLDASYRRVVDTELWCRTPRRIIMDSDILFMREPTEVIQWMASGTRPFLMGQPPKPAAPVSATPEKKHIQTVFKEKLTDMTAALGWPRIFEDGTTSGFYGCLSEVSLPRIEEVIRKATEVGIPMHEWGGEQCTVIYLLSISNPIRLDEHRYFNFFAEYADRLQRASLAHFIGTDRFYRQMYTGLASEMVAQLPSR
jgi:hypothetical protein